MRADGDGRVRVLPPGAGDGIQVTRATGRDRPGPAGRHFFGELSPVERENVWNW
ncbi:hypothetical protein GA0074694_3926 [Micromonospora inyonensis]|uniref:Uncharacterized protein n=1 Tax=Micromonospora inyonensis TaxID=47866 RepID=A0A1C6S580_9ACTN|nr:hypothetical protein GA0074694_3926 [Micromonospora inyonensis]